MLAAFAVGFAAALLLGAVAGWQARGYHELARRRVVDLTDQRRPGGGSR